MQNNKSCLVGLFLFFCILTFLICHLTLPSGAMGVPVPKEKSSGFVVDDFHKGILSGDRDWWTFGAATIEVVNSWDYYDGDAIVMRDMHEYAVKISANTKTGRYVGGMGCDFAKENQDLSSYKNLQMDIFGYGQDNGAIRIELFDDDNGNFQVEQDAKTYQPLKDDRYVREINVNWEGWKRVVVPFSEFKDDNPKIGDDVWNIKQKDGSGGLLQCQFIFLTNRKVGTVRYLITNVRLMK